MSDTTRNTQLVAAALAGPQHIALMPIVERDGTVRAYEALARWDFASPYEVFVAAGDAGLRVPAEMAAIRAAIAELHRLPDGCRLSLNVSADSLSVADTLTVLLPHADRLWVEVTEVAPVDPGSPAVSALAALRQAGAVIAVDDAGAGFATLEMVRTVAPSVIKLDMDLVRGAAAGDLAVLETFVSFIDEASATGAEVVAEGIDPDTDLDGVLASCHMLQGFGVGRPFPAEQLV